MIFNKTKINVTNDSLNLLSLVLCVIRDCVNNHLVSVCGLVFSHLLCFCCVQIWASRNDVRIAFALKPSIDVRIILSSSTSLFTFQLTEASFFFCAMTQHT